MIQLYDYMDDANVLDSEDWLDDPDDLLLEDQEDVRDDKEKQPRHPRIILDEELATEAIILAAVPGKKENYPLMPAALPMPCASRMCTSRKKIVF